MPAIRAYIVGAWDASNDELLFARERLALDGISTVTVDIGPGSSAAADVPAAFVAGHHPEGPGAVLEQDDPAAAATAMGQALARCLGSYDDIGGLLAIGEPRAATILAPLLQVLPIGLPKVLVSTIPPAEIEPYVGTSDVATIHTPELGLSSVTRVIVGNAAHALAGMMRLAQTIPRD